MGHKYKGKSSHITVATEDKTGGLGIYGGCRGCMQSLGFLGFLEPVDEQGSGNL